MKVSINLASEGRDKVIDIFTELGGEPNTLIPCDFFESEGLVV